MELTTAEYDALRALIDREAIRNCLVRYTRGIDRHDASLVASAYHRSALDDHTNYVGPGTGFGAVANASHDAIWEAHQHYITNISIELAGDSAHAETYWTFVGRRKGNAATDVHGGRYIDRLAKRADVWAIDARICVYEWGLRPEDALQSLASFPLGTQDRSDLSFVRPLVVTRKPTG